MSAFDGIDFTDGGSVDGAGDGFSAGEIPGGGDTIPSFTTDPVGDISNPTADPNLIPQYDSSGNVVGYYSMGTDNSVVNQYGPTGTFEGTTTPADIQNQSFLQSIGLGGLSNLFGGGTSGGTGTGGSGFGNLGTLLGLGGGLAGLIGALTTAGRTSTGTTTNHLTPQAQAALNQALPYLNTLENLMTASQTGLASQVGALAPQSDQTLANVMSELNQLVPAGLQAGNYPGLSQAQNSLLGAIQPYAQGLATGNFQIPEALTHSVEQMYQPFVNQSVQQVIEALNKQGFAGSGELLASGPGNALLGPMLADLPGAEAQTAMQAYLSQLPSAQSQLIGAFNQPLQTQSNFAQNLANIQQGAGQQGITNQLSAIQATNPASVQANIGTGTPLAGQNTSNTSAFAGQLNNIMQGLQGLGTSLSNLNRTA